jgi:hypothetical protein
MSEHSKLTEKGVQALQKALEAKNVKVDPQTLKAAVNEAHSAAIDNCDGCANGWHW